MDEVIDWVKRCPNPHKDGGVIEIRVVFKAADFAEACTPGLREREERLRAEAQSAPGS